MYAVEFEAPIENGIVHIPQEYKDLQKNLTAKFIVMYDNGVNNVQNNDKKSIIDSLAGKYEIHNNESLDNIKDKAWEIHIKEKYDFSD
jgi:hypothetical protein